MKQRGFVLIELLIVLVMIGIITSITLLKINSVMVTLDLDNAAKELVGDLRYIQQLSTNSGTGPFYSILFDPGTPSGYYIFLNTNGKKHVQFPTDIRINLPIPKQFSFGMNGYPPHGMTIYLQSGKEFRHVIIDSVGRVRIYNPNLH